MWYNILRERVYRVRRTRYNRTQKKTMSVHNDDGSSLHPLAFVSPNSKAYVNELHSRIQFQHDAKDLATFIINPSMANLRNSSNGE